MYIEIMRFHWNIVAVAYVNYSLVMSSVYLCNLLSGLNVVFQIGIKLINSSVVFISALCPSIFFSPTTRPIGTKLSRNVTWVIFNVLHDYCFIGKSNMAGRPITLPNFKNILFRCHMVEMDPISIVSSPGKRPYELLPSLVCFVCQSEIYGNMNKKLMAWAQTRRVYKIYWRPYDQLYF